jgi:hypothetical protein
MLEMAIADFYAVNEGGLVKVQVVDDNYYIIGNHQIGSGTAYTREEIEWAAITTAFDVEYIE